MATPSLGLELNLPERLNRRSDYSSLRTPRLRFIFVLFPPGLPCGLSLLGKEFLGALGIAEPLIDSPSSIRLLTMLTDVR